jgi:hypothetical protein
LPSERIIRRYPNIRSVALHLIDINKEFTALIHRLSAVVASDKVIRISPGSKVIPLAKTNIASQTVKKIADNSALLLKLHEQSAALSNMILALNTTFSTQNVDDTLISALRKNISSLQAKIKLSLQKAEVEAEEHGTRLAQQKTVNVIKKIKLYLDKRFSSKGDISYTSGVAKATVGMKGKQLPEDQKNLPKEEQKKVDVIRPSSTSLPVITCFLQYTNIKNTRGEIEPSIVIAVTEKNGIWYVNPGLIRILPLGQFNLGFVLPEDEKQACDFAIKKVQAQMEADSQLSAINQKAVPFEETHVNLRVEGVGKVEFTSNTIEITLRPSIKSAAEAEAFVQKNLLPAVYRAFRANHPRSRDRVVYVPHKVSTNVWGITFKFTTGDKYTGRTLTHEENEKLSEVFDERELKAIRQKLNDLIG